MLVNTNTPLGVSLMIGATLFSGGRGVECLLRDDIDFVLAVEIDPAIAAVGAQLGGETIVSDVCAIDFATWPALDYLHASPVCKNASQAKTNGHESDADIQTAEAVCRALRAIQPRVFTLENVQGYARFAAFRRICQTLDALGYMWHWEVLNSADFGVPQTRRRLILRAVLGALLPTWPAPEPWIGWYAAIEDLLPGLPASAFAPWQLARLPEHIGSNALFSCAGNNGDFGNDLTIVPPNQPSFAISVAHTAAKYRAFIVSNAATMDIRNAPEPMVTVTATTHSKAAMPRAWLVDGDGNRSREPTVLDQDTPSMTIQAWHGRRPIQAPRAWLSAGRVVKMTPRALARFQSIPDWYVLPDKASLACQVIGNAVPPLLMSKIVRPLL